MANSSKLKTALEQKTPLLLDGAIGTELYNRGIFINRCFEEAVLSNPGIIKELHKEYVKAGATILSTNSWGANRFKLKEHNLQDKVGEICAKSVELVKSVANDDTIIAGCVGPLGVRMEPWGSVSVDEAVSVFSEQIHALAEAGVDYINLETFADLAEIEQAIVAARKAAPDLPISAGVTINMKSELAMGGSLQNAVRKLDEWGADIICLSCSVGPGLMLSAIERMKKWTNKPLAAIPNAGLPRAIEGRTIYMCTAEYMGEYTKNFLQEGVFIVGGCCGTSPEHTKVMAQAFRQYVAMSHADQSKPIIEVKSSGKQVEEVKEKERVPFSEKSSWSKKIAQGERVYTLELLPPSGTEPRKLIESSRRVKEAGVDAINIPDGPRASSRMSAILSSVLIEQEVGIETILHYTCRDRNLISMQSDILGAHVIGLRNVLLITGDPPKLGDYPDVTGVFDVDAVGLTRMVHSLNGGVDIGGRAVGEPTSLSIGVGVNPGHRDFEYEMRRFKFKVEAGAEWAITQPLFDIEAMYRFLDYLNKENINIPIIAGIWPLVSLRNARFLHNEIPGIEIPDEVMRRMEKPASADDAKKVGVEIAHEMQEKLGNDVQGIQVSAPFGRIDLALQVIDKA